MDMGYKGNTDNLDAVVQFRVTKARKNELDAFAKGVGMSVGEMMRKMTETVEVLFDPELKFSDVIRSMPDLRDLITNRKTQSD